MLGSATALTSATARRLHRVATVCQLVVHADHPTLADLGYVGVEGIDDVPYKRFPGVDLNASQTAFNTALSKARAAVEHAIAHLKAWRMLSEEGGRYPAPLEKYPSMLKAVTGLFFFAAYE